MLVTRTAWHLACHACQRHTSDTLCRPSRLQGSVGATVRVYIEKYEADPSKLDMKTADALADLVAIALETADIEKYTSRKEPTVIT